MRTAVTLMLSIALLSGPASAAMFKWKGADGTTQYGQHPPSGAEATRIESDREPSSAPARKSLQEQVKEMDEREEQQQDARAEAELNKKNAAVRKQNCANARANITQLGYGGHRLAAMPDGSYERFTEAEKQAMIKKNQKAVEEYCD